MRRGISRRQLQERLRSVIVEELGRMDIPQDGQHLGRFARALIHEAIEALTGAGLPKGVVAQVVAHAAKKALAAPSAAALGALGQPLKTGCA